MLAQARSEGWLPTAFRHRSRHRATTFSPTVANAAGDFEHMTLGICPALDSAVYTLTGYR